MVSIFNFSEAASLATTRTPLAIISTPIAPGPRPISTSLPSAGPSPSSSFSLISQSSGPPGRARQKTGKLKRTKRFYSF